MRNAARPFFTHSGGFAPVTLPPLPSGAVLDVRECPPPGSLAAARAPVLGGRVWPAAAALCRWLRLSRPALLGLPVVELGSGTGAVGLYAAALGASRVALTDGSAEVMDLLRANATRNAPHHSAVVSVSALRWGDGNDAAAAWPQAAKPPAPGATVGEMRKFVRGHGLDVSTRGDFRGKGVKDAVVAACDGLSDCSMPDASNAAWDATSGAEPAGGLVLGSDLTYFVDDHRPLCGTIAALLAARPLARAVLAHQRRGLLFRGGRTPGDHHLDHFCAIAAASGLRVTAVPGAAAEAASGAAGENVSHSTGVLMHV